jgi:hypothetical protein
MWKMAVRLRLSRVDTESSPLRGQRDTRGWVAAAHVRISSLIGGGGPPDGSSSAHRPDRSSGRSGGHPSAGAAPKRVVGMRDSHAIRARLDGDLGSGRARTRRRPACPDPMGGGHRPFLRAASARAAPEARAREAHDVAVGSRRAGARAGAKPGNRSEKVEPTVELDTTQRPPWARAIVSTIASPRPTPP